MVGMVTAGSRPQLQIRSANENDAPSLCEIFNEAVQDRLETLESGVRRVEEQRLLIAVASRDPKHPILAADVRNWIAGWVALQPSDTRIALADIGEVFIYVRRSFRNYGVGRQLMRAVQEASSKLGYRKLLGRILASNRDGLLLCRALGWREVGRHAAHAKLNGELHDVILVEYQIPAPGRDPHVTDNEYMNLAMNQARAAAMRGEVPIGAVVVLNDGILAAAGNQTIADCDPTAHAEIVALRAAAQVFGNYRLTGTALYVTLEPCAMCAGAIVQARIARLIYGAVDPKGGAIHTCLQVLDAPAINHRVEVTAGVLAAQSAELLQSFFSARR